MLPAPALPGGLRCPSGLEVGDGLLFSPAEPRAYQEAIVVCQEKVIRRGGALFRATVADACFTHVGMYAGDGNVFDATRFTDAAIRPFDAVVEGGFYVRARRLTAMTVAHRNAIAGAMQNHRGRYSTASAVVDGLLAATPAPWDQALHWLVRHSPFGTCPREVFYCSALIEGLLLAQTGRSTLGPGIIAALPWTFSSDPQFAEVKIAW